MNKLWWIRGANKLHTRPEHQQILSFMHQANYEAEKVVYSYHLPGDVVYLIQKGTIALHQSTPAQTRRHLLDLGPGDFFGSLHLLEIGIPQGIAIASEDCILQVLRKSGLEQWVKYFPEIESQWIEALQQDFQPEFKNLNTRYLRLIYCRLCRLLLHFLDHPAYQIKGKAMSFHAEPRELANLLGTHRQVIHKCLEILEKKQIIQKNNYELTLKNRLALEQEC